MIREILHYKFILPFGILLLFGCKGKVSTVCTDKMPYLPFEHNQLGDKVLFTNEYGDTLKFSIDEYYTTGEQFVEETYDKSRKSAREAYNGLCSSSMAEIIGSGTYTDSVQEDLILLYRIYGNDQLEQRQVQVRIWDYVAYFEADSDPPDPHDGELIHQKDFHGNTYENVLHFYHKGGQTVQEVWYDQEVGVIGFYHQPDGFFTRVGP